MEIVNKKNDKNNTTHKIIFALQALGNISQERNKKDEPIQFVLKIIFC